MADPALKLALVLQEIKNRGGSKHLEIRDPNYPEQDRFVMDQSRFLGACTTRRAGKSNALGLRFFRTLQSHPGAFCPYIALTRESAKNIMWPVLQEIDEKYKIGAKFTDSNLTVTIPRFDHARIQLFGADMKNFIKRLRGIKTPGVGVDEAQDFSSHLESLIDDVLTPATSDYTDGWIALTGTPGPIPHGYFYEVSEQKKYGYSLHSWSLFQNPYLPNPRGFVEELKKKKGWLDNNPTLLREYYGQWVLDLDALVFKYKREKNDYTTLPKLDHYVIGVDIGFNDADALSVLGWSDQSPAVYLVEEVVNRGETVTGLAERITHLISKYDPIKIVMDTGGLGKKIAEELTRRYSLPIQAAEKTRKFEFIELLNDALRTGRFFAKQDSVFAQDCARVKWDQERSLGDKLVISDSFHSDAVDSCLYGYREALHWLYETPTKRPSPGTPEALKQEEEEMEETALIIQKQNNMDENHSFFGWNDTSW